MSCNRQQTCFFQVPKYFLFFLVVKHKVSSLMLNKFAIKNYTFKIYIDVFFFTCLKKLVVISCFYMYVLRLYK